MVVEYLLESASAKSPPATLQASLEYVESLTQKLSEAEKQRSIAEEEVRQHNSDYAERRTADQVSLRRFQDRFLHFEAEKRRKLYSILERIRNVR